VYQARFLMRLVIADITSHQNHDGRRHRQHEQRQQYPAREAGADWRVACGTAPGGAARVDRKFTARPSPGRE